MTTRRFRLAACVVALLTICAGQSAGQSVTFSQLLTVTSSTAVQLSGSASGSTFCRGVLEGGNIRMALDGSTPTATAGRPVYVGERIHLNNAQDVSHFSAIATSSTTTTIWMYCGGGSVPTVSTIESPPTSSALPLCNALTRPAGNCR